MKTNTKQAINEFLRLPPYTPLLLWHFPAWRLLFSSYTLSCSQPFTSSHCLIEFLFISDLSLTLFFFYSPFASLPPCLKHSRLKNEKTFSFVSVSVCFLFFVGRRQKAIEWLSEQSSVFTMRVFGKAPARETKKLYSGMELCKKSSCLGRLFLFLIIRIELIHSLTLYKFDYKASVFSLSTFTTIQLLERMRRWTWV